MAVRWSGLLVRSASQEATKDHPKGRQRTPVSMGCRCCCQFVKCANLTNLQGYEFVNWLGGMDLGAVRSSWDEYRDQRRRSLEAYKQYAHPWGAGQGERRRFKKSQALTSPTSRSRPELARTSHQRQIPGALRILCKASVGCA